MNRVVHVEVLRVDEQAVDLVLHAESLVVGKALIGVMVSNWVKPAEFESGLDRLKLRWLRLVGRH